MATHTIKETCSCGAVLEYTEDTNKVWETYITYVQDDFHREHKACKPKKEEKTNNQSKVRKVK